MYQTSIKNKRFFVRMALGLFGCCFVLLNGLDAQSDNPYHLNGNAYQENCHCYTLTKDTTTFLMGSVWNVNKIDLNQAFDFHFNIFLGCHDEDGADGIAFVLQPLGTSIGTFGEGIGIQGVSPSVAVVIDTYQNYNRGDPSYDHIDIHLNGDINHNSPNDIAGPVTALDGNDNIEDCNWHILRVSWNPSTGLMLVFVDGKERLRTTFDMVNTVFHGDSKVFWGFTGATGGLTNRQRFCTSLNAGFSIPEDQVTCFPTPITFTDSSTSFGKIVNWLWDFGDGTTDNSPQPPPHVFPVPGNYLVKLNIVGNDGCVSDPFSQQIVAGSKPVAKFNPKSPPYCTDRLIPFYDVSTVEFGTINQRLWTVNNQVIQADTAGFQQQFPLGQSHISLVVKTQEGCTSDVFEKDITVYITPTITAKNVVDMCKNEKQNFSAAGTSGSIAINKWYWTFGDGGQGYSANMQHSYRDTGSYNIAVFGTTTDGCASDTLWQPIHIYGTNAYAGHDTIVGVGQPLQLQATGGDSYWWSPSAGLSNPTISNPVATLQQDAMYILTANSPANCPTKDTIHIKVYIGPELYVPTGFTPNGDGRNDIFRFTSVGMSAIHFFKVFNRFGQQVFSSSTPYAGWDGNLNGQPQPTGTYIWMIESVDYKGNLVRKKGVTVLIR